MSYLTRRDGRYSYRRRFPNDVAELLGRSEYRKALGTADRTEALKLARMVSVEFDRVCEDALSKVSQDATPPSPAEVLASLDEVVRTMTLTVIELQQKPGWQTQVAWRRDALQAHVQGKMPPGVQMHPMIAQAALRALEGVLAGNPVYTEASNTPLEPVPAPRRASQAPTSQSAPGTRSAADFDAVLEEYCEGVGTGRANKLRNLHSRVLEWPSDPDAQVQRILQYCSNKLEAGGKPSSVHSDAAALITVLRRLDGWGQVTLPKRGAVAKTVRAGAGMGKDQRDPIPLQQMLGMHGRIAVEFPQHHAAAVLLARYGLRPGELLQEGPEALSTRTDVMGNAETVFRAGLSGGKNSAARRDLPVHEQDVPLFKAVLDQAGFTDRTTKSERTSRATQRVRNLSRVFRRYLPEGSALTLYSQRHSCADLLRNAGATAEEVGMILGHTQAGSKATAVYGGSQSLSRLRELLSKVRALIP